MKYKTMTPHELTLKTIEDIARKRGLEKEGQRQALEHCMSNKERIKKRLKRYSYRWKYWIINVQAIGNMRGEFKW